MCEWEKKSKRVIGKMRKVISHAAHLPVCLSAGLSAHVNTFEKAQYFLLSQAAFPYISGKYVKAETSEADTSVKMAGLGTQICHVTEH